MATDDSSAFQADRSRSKVSYFLQCFGSQRSMASIAARLRRNFGGAMKRGPGLHARPAAAMRGSSSASICCLARAACAFVPCSAQIAAIRKRDGKIQGARYICITNNCRTVLTPRPLSRNDAQPCVQQRSAASSLRLLASRSHGPTYRPSDDLARLTATVRGGRAASSGRPAAQSLRLTIDIRVVTELTRVPDQDGRAGAAGRRQRRPDARRPALVRRATDQLSIARQSQAGVQQRTRHTGHGRQR
jgi:hypothetical protein